MQLSISEKFILLAHHPLKARFITPPQFRNIGLIGSILLDLSMEEKIDIDSGKLIVKNVNTDLPLPHKLLLKQVNDSQKTRKVKNWISRFSNKSRKFQKEILLKLKEKGMLTLEEKKFLFIKYHQSRLTNSYLREQIIQDIRKMIFDNASVDHEKALICGLINSCRMQRIICQNFKEVKFFKARLKEIDESDIISQNVGQVIKEMQSAIMVAVIASAAASTAATSH